MTATRTRDAPTTTDRGASDLLDLDSGRSNETRKRVGKAVKTDAVGKTYPPSMYAVGREKVREYALAVGETNPLHLDVRAARRAGYADVVAPPMFAVVYSTPAVVMAVFDPDVAMDFAMEVHGAQEFRWGPLVIAPYSASWILSGTQSALSYRSRPRGDRDPEHQPARQSIPPTDVDL